MVLGRSAGSVEWRRRVLLARLREAFQAEASPARVRELRMEVPASLRRVRVAPAWRKAKLTRRLSEVRERVGARTKEPLPVTRPMEPLALKMMLLWLMVVRPV